MKRFTKRIFCALLCLLLTAVAGGCMLPEAAPEFTGDTSPSSFGSPYKYYFDRLPDKEKIAYNAVLSVIDTFPERIEVPVLTQEELNEMYAALLFDNPELFFINSETILRQVKNRAYLYPDYRMNAEDYDAMSRKCADIAAQIVRQARDESSAFDRERVVHDRLIARCSYSDDETDVYRSTIYGALCGCAAACEGYAKTAKFLLDMLDIPCFVVHGNSTPPGSRTQSHMWNVVQLDGDWYHLDLTWDDPVLEKGNEILSYSYFNVTDAALRTTHTDYDAGVSCTATRCNFFVHENLLFTTFDDAEKAQAVTYAAQTVRAGSDGFQLRFADETSFEQAKETLFKNAEIYVLLKQIQKLSERTFATDRVIYYSTDTDNTIEILLEY